MVFILKHSPSGNSVFPAGPPGKSINSAGLPGREVSLGQFKCCANIHCDHNKYYVINAC